MVTVQPIAICVLGCRLITSSLILVLPLALVPFPMANDEVTDRRVNCHGGRQRIRRTKGYGPRRFGGLNG